MSWVCGTGNSVGGSLTNKMAAQNLLIWQRWQFRMKNSFERVHFCSPNTLQMRNSINFGKLMNKIFWLKFRNECIELEAHEKKIIRSSWLRKIAFEENLWKFWYLIDNGGQRKKQKIIIRFALHRPLIFICFRWYVLFNNGHIMEVKKKLSKIKR